MNKLNIGVIGGGLSGLTAANELYKTLKNKANITIIEKEPQLGGRIFTKEFRGCPIELGAQFFVHNGKVHSLIKSLNLGKNIIPLDKRFISFYYKNKVCNIDEVLKDNNYPAGAEEKLLSYAKRLNYNKELITQNFEEWYKDKIGDKLLFFWNRLFISIGVKDIKSINAYFGLILINVFFGKNYLLRGGLEKLVNNLTKIITDLGGKIITNAECRAIENKNNKYVVKYETEGIKKSILFDKIIFTIKPDEILKIKNLKNFDLIKKISGHPMALYVIEIEPKLWTKTWGLVISKEESPIYALCDWRNVTNLHKTTPILSICNPDSTKDEIISEFRNLFPQVIGSKIKIFYEKKWNVGLHQADELLFKIPKVIKEYLPPGIYLGGDWMVLPALEGAVISGENSAQLLINDLI